MISVQSTKYPDIDNLVIVKTRITASRIALIKRKLKQGGTNPVHRLSCLCRTSCIVIREVRQIVWEIRTRVRY